MLVALTDPGRRPAERRRDRRLAARRSRLAARRGAFVDPERATAPASRRASAGRSDGACVGAATDAEGATGATGPDIDDATAGATSDGDRGRWRRRSGRGSRDRAAGAGHVTALARADATAAVGTVGRRDRSTGRRLRRDGRPTVPRRRSRTRRRPPPAALLAAIRAALPDLRLLTDAADREAYRNDETAYLQAGLPLAVALPSRPPRSRPSSASPRSTGSRSCRAAPAPG